ncbi:MAG TPA: zf-HC2 domain-containing protein [Gaiellaceae bacterium]
MRNRAFQCGQTAELVSLELDGELSELEAARLEEHLGHCAACRALRAELAGLTLALRAVPLERLERPVTLPRGSGLSLRPLQVGAAAAAIAVVAGLTGVMTTLHSQGTTQPHFVPGIPGPADSINSLRTLRRARLVPPQLPFGQAAGGRLDI